MDVFKLHWSTELWDIPGTKRKFVLKYMHRKPFPCMSQSFSTYMGLCSGCQWAQQMLDFHAFWWRIAGLREYLIESSYCRGRKETSSVLSVVGGAVCSHILLHIRSITWRRNHRDIPKCRPNFSQRPYFSEWNQSPSWEANFSSPVYVRFRTLWGC